MIYKSLINESMLINPSQLTLSAWSGHIPFGAALINELNPRIFVELGTHTGNSYFAFCQAVVENKLDSKCYAVDTWLGDKHSFHYGEEVFQNLNEYHKNHYARFSTLMRMTFDDALAHFNDGSVDLLHIDGLHTYKAVKHDFQTWLPKMSDRGVVLFHDINVRERDFGVFKLWEELQPLYPHIEFDHSFGLGVLFVGSIQTNKIKDFIKVCSNKRHAQQTKKLFAYLGERIVQRYEIITLDKEMRKRDEQIANLNQIMIERDEEISNLNRSATERDEQITSLNQIMIERDEEISKLNRNATERDEQIESLNQIMIERDREISKLNRGTIKRDGQIESLNQMMIERDKQISNLNQMMIERDKQISKLNRGTTKRNEQIENLNQMIIERDKQISELNRGTTKRDEQIENLNQIMIERDEQIANLNQIMIERDVQIANLNQIMIERDEEISKLNRGTTERDEQLASLNQAAIDRDGEISVLKQLAEDRYQEIINRDYIIHEFKTSRAWRVTRPLRYFSEKCRLFYKILKSLVKAVVNIPAAISHWGVKGLFIRILRRYKEGGSRMLLGRSNAFPVYIAQYSSNKRAMDEIRIKNCETPESRTEPTKPIYPATHPTRNLHFITYLINDHDLMTQQYRVVNYSEALSSLGYECEIIRDGELTESTCVNSDILVLNRIVWSPHIDRLIKQFKKSDRPVIFDIDDFVFDSSQIELLRATKRMGDSDKQRTIFFMDGISKTIQLSDAVTTSTFALMKKVEEYYSLPSYVLPNNLGNRQIDFSKKLKKERSLVSSTNNIVRIGYFSGTKTHEEDFAECAEAIQNLLLKYSNVELLIVGPLDLPANFRNIQNRIYQKSLMPYNEMLKELSTVDINLAPLELNNTFTDCKSELKIFEAALFGIPTIASATSTFSATISNEKTGFLASTLDEWEAALSRLVKDRKLRFQLGEAARKEISARFSIDTTAEEAKTIYEAAFSKTLRRKLEIQRNALTLEQRPLITIVSILYRKAREVRYFLEALNRQDFPGEIEIILVDDNTPDDTVAVVNDFNKWATNSNNNIEIKILENTQNIGNCGSRNKAIKEARGDIIVVVDADCMFSRSFLSYHYESYLRGDCDVAIGPINIETHNRHPFSVLGQHETTPSLTEAENLPQDPLNLESFVNCITRNFSIRRAFLEEVLQIPLFDEAFSYSSDPQSGFGWEDVEMGYRLYVSGARIKYLEDTFSIHVSHESSTEESGKPIRSLRNYRRLFEKHPNILLASRQWSIKTYEAILSWSRAVGAELEKNDDYQWLEKRFRRYRQTPIIIDKSRKLRVLTYRWHVSHQYELYKTGHDFTLLTGTGTKLCEHWEFAKRPMPNNCCIKAIEQINLADFDLAILHFDENVLRPDLCHRMVPADWGDTFRWFISNVDLPKIAICHGTPQFIGQYNSKYAGSNLGQVLDDERKSLVDFLDDTTVVCNSHQAESEWSFRNSRTIWHGLTPSEFPPGNCENGVLVMPEDALRNRPHYNGLAIYESVKNILNGHVNVNCLKTPDPSILYQPNTKDWAIARYQNYVRELGRYDIYFNPTIRSPMPRSRSEAMMAGLVSVSLRNHDVDLFIKNGVNGFYADSNEELADQIHWLSKHSASMRKMAKASRNTAMDIFNQDRYLSNWSQLINSIIS